MVKIDYQGQLLLKGSTDHFGHVNLFVNLTLLNIFCSLQFISIYNNIHDNIQEQQNFLKITNSEAAT